MTRSVAKTAAEITNCLVTSKGFNEAYYLSEDDTGRLPSPFESWEEMIDHIVDVAEFIEAHVEKSRGEYEYSSWHKFDWYISCDNVAAQMLKALPETLQPNTYIECVASTKGTGWTS